MVFPEGCNQGDYIIWRRKEVNRIHICKVLPGGAVTEKNKVDPCKAVLGTEEEQRTARIRTTWWWKLNKVGDKEKFARKVQAAMDVQANKLWEETRNVLRKTAKEVPKVASEKPRK